MKMSTLLKTTLQMPQFTIASIVAAASVIGISVPAHALSFFSGEDLNSSATVPLSSFPNSAAARADFLARLTGVGTENFEGFSTGTGVPLSLTFPGAGTATLSGSGRIQSQAPGTASFGRYATSGSRFLEVDADEFAIDFSSPVAAFGFSGVDIGDFGGRLSLTLLNGTSRVFNVPNTVGSNGSIDGSVLFYGLIANDPSEVFTRIVFNNSAGGSDVFAFDDMTIGSLSQVQPEPIPTPALLPGLIGMGLATLRKRKAEAAE